jgi:hypothetical protein
MFPMGTVFQLHIAPLNFFLHVHAFLEGVYDYSIGRGKPLPWPSFSPDLTALDFSFRVFIKDVVYCEKV